MGDVFWYLDRWFSYLYKPLGSLNKIFIASMLEDIESYAEKYSLNLEMDDKLKEIMELL